MRLNDLSLLLEANPYPGRGIVMGFGPDGMHAHIAYFIMGRSENSRNRVFTKADGGILTEPADPAKVEDPSLILYNAVRRAGELTIVTNGDQTDTIYDALMAARTFEDAAGAGAAFEGALRSRTFEPDGPNFTPRISGLLALGLAGFTYKLSILKSAGGDSRSVQRFFFDYPQPLPGQGHFISTYEGDGDPLPSFTGEPVPVAIQDNLDAFGDSIWNSLNEANKVSLFVQRISLDGRENTRIYNKYSK